MVCTLVLVMAFQVVLLLVKVLECSPRTALE